MTTGTRISRSIEDFNRYSKITAAYLVAGTPDSNGIRLNLTQKEIDG